MKIRLARAVIGDDGRVDLRAWNVQVLADLPVGTCGCGASAYGLRIVRGRRPLFATVVCPACGSEAATPVLDTMAAAA